MYDPVVGRFVNEDPSEFESGDMNLYRYCRNNPVNMIDPTGLCGIKRDDPRNLAGLLSSADTATPFAPADLLRSYGPSSFDTWQASYDFQVNQEDAGVVQHDFLAFSDPVSGIAGSNVMGSSAVFSEDPWHKVDQSLREIPFANPGDAVPTRITVLPGGPGLINGVLAIPGLVLEAADLNRISPMSGDASKSKAARTSIRENIRPLKQDAVNQISTMLAANPPKMRDGSVMGKDQRAVVANSLADTYIRAVDKFLDRFPAAQPSQGHQHAFARSPEWRPVCEDWGNAIGYEMSQNTYAKTGVVQIVGPELTIGHNVTAIVSGGHAVNWGNVSRSAAPFVIMDPWPDIQPRVYQYSAPNSPYTTRGSGYPFDATWIDEHWSK
jgi:hypothetical protein